MKTEIVNPSVQAQRLLLAIAILREDVQGIAKKRAFPIECRRLAKEALSNFDAAVGMPAEFRMGGRKVRLT